jgi:alcohol dehydrogenase
MPLKDVSAFRSYLPVRIAFGDGVANELASVLAELRAERALVVLEEPVAAIDGVGSALAACEAAGVALERYRKPPGEPTFDSVDECADAIERFAPQAVVAVGGGSTLDLGKAARLVADQGGPLQRFLDDPAAFQPATRAFVALPTTSGTGSEVSGAAVVTDPSSHLKLGLANPLMRAYAALVDPLLTVGLPPRQTAETGADALAQAIGGVIVTNGNPLSVAVGLEGCRHAAIALPRVVRDGSDLDARREMALASLLAGLAMNLSDCSAEHSFGHALGGLLGLPHGLTIGLLLAETLDVSRVDCAERLERVADALGEPADGTSDGSRAVRAVRRLLAAIDFPTLGQSGVEERHVDELVEHSLGTYNLEVDPHDWSAGDVREVFCAALALASR